MKAFPLRATGYEVMLVPGRSWALESPLLSPLLRPRGMTDDPMSVYDQGQPQIMFDLLTFYTLLIIIHGAPGQPLPRLAIAARQLQ